MGQQDVFSHRHHGGIVVVLKGGVDSGHQSQPTEHLRLVEGHPVGDTAAEGLRGRVHIVGKPFDDLRVLPAAFSIESSGKVPVIEGHQRLDAVCQQLVTEVLVEFHPCLIDLAHPLGQNARPADREAVAFRPICLIRLRPLSSGDKSRWRCRHFRCGRCGQCRHEPACPRWTRPCRRRSSHPRSGWPQWMRSTKIFRKFRHSSFSFTAC